MIHMPLLSLFAKTADECHKGNFLGLRPWYHYLPDNRFTDKCDITTSFRVFPDGDLKSDVPLVLLAVVDDLLRIAGIVAVAFILVGAIKYITSQGQPEDTAKAQSTIINALIGLAIAIIAATFVSFVGNKLGSS